MRMSFTGKGLWGILAQKLNLMMLFLSHDAALCGPIYYNFSILSLNNFKKLENMIMLKNVIVKFVIFLFCCFYLTGCETPGTKATVTSGQDSPDMAYSQQQAYNGPQARIAVARFKDKTGGGWWTGSIGDGMADQLTTALYNTNRYIVLEREALDDVLSEQDLGASGRVRADTAAKVGQIEGAELLVVAAVTEFDGAASGAEGGLTGMATGVLGGSYGTMLGGALGGYKKAHMAIDMRIVDAKTSRVLAATSVEGEATDVNLGGFAASGALAGGLGGWKNTPTEKALRVCIQKAVEFIVSKTPPKYYHD
ncbi:MAG: hypothetical protein C4518_16745 [Desulfobacteraceae bacterium]|nr:MAG: hypothetical protein C4518_16745 [Desulfobacteraceae bacterium]